MEALTSPWECPRKIHTLELEEKETRISEESCLFSPGLSSQYRPLQDTNPLSSQQPHWDRDARRLLLGAWSALVWANLHVDLPLSLTPRLQREPQRCHGTSQSFWNKARNGQNVSSAMGGCMFCLLLYLAHSRHSVSACWWMDGGREGGREERPHAALTWVPAACAQRMLALWRVPLR